MIRNRMRGIMLGLAVVFMLGSTSAYAVSTNDAIDAVDLSKPCSIELTYSVGGSPFDNETVTIIPVAALTSALDYTLLSPFSASGVDLSTVHTAADWKNIAFTLYAYAVANSVPGTTQVTDTNGKANFTGLSSGLYLVKRHVSHKGGSTYTFHPYLVAVPTVGSDSKWLYDVKSVPKYEVYTPGDPGYPPASVTYSVSKIWDDDGDHALRPDSVDIEIYKDGAFVELKTLSAGGGWTYSWSTTDISAEWLVVERNVPDGYSVSISQKDAAFSVCNSMKEDAGEDGTGEDGTGEDTGGGDETGEDDEFPDASPRTGDTSRNTLYLTLMLASGIMLLILSVFGFRKKERKW